MCNRYTPPDWVEIEREWHIGARNQPAWPREIFPRTLGPFIRRARNDAGYARELVVGQWGLIPWFAKEPKLKYPTNNARGEELAQKPSYRDPWKRGQRCIIPAATFDEPNWETGKNIWWRFAAPMACHGDWRACGTFGPTRRQARSTRATPCSH